MVDHNASGIERPNPALHIAEYNWLCTKSNLVSDNPSSSGYVRNSVTAKYEGKSAAGAVHWPMDIVIPPWSRTSFFCSTASVSALFPK